MGEFELLAKLRERLPSPGNRVRLGSGDDAAVTVPGGATATSVDALVEGVHFRRPGTDLALVGGKAIATALSDLAAMGAEPGEAYLVVGVPPDLDEEGCLELADGAIAAASAHGVAIAGGDITRAPALTLAVTVVGHAPEADRFVSRRGARPGDVLVVTGELGGAAAGLALEDDPGLARSIGPAVAEGLRRRQLEPQPRLAAGAALAASGATAMIDVSDGLGADAGHLAEASGVRLTIEAGDLPLAPGVVEVAAAAGRDPLQLAVSGGEDYELLSTLPPERLDAAERGVVAGGTALTLIGGAGPGEGVEIRRPPGGPELEPTGFDQLA